MQRRLELRLIVLLAVLVGLAISTPDAAHAQSTATSPEPSPSASGTQTQTEPYKAVAITLPSPLDDQGFEALRAQLIDIAERRDRAALERLIVGKGFFWQRDNGDAADPKKSGLANFAAAIGLDNPDDPDIGWDTIAIYAEDSLVSGLSDRPGVVCGPADPAFDEGAFEALLEATQTDVGEWVYPLADDVELRSAPRSDAPVVEKVELAFIRVMSFDASPDAENPEADDFVRVMLPSGKLGYIMISDLAALSISQICYVKEGDAWKITGVLGGE